MDRPSGESAARQPAEFAPARTERGGCPVCGGAARTERRSEEAAGMVFSIVGCRDCAMVYVADPIADPTLIYEFPSKARTAAYHPRHHHSLAVMKRHFGALAGLRVVDVGCGFGAFLSLLAEREGVRGVGFEPARMRAEFARNRGVDVVTDLFRADALEGPADAIMLDNVLEHLLEPRAMIAEIARALRPGGLLVCIVPNLNDLRRFTAPRKFWVPFKHVNFFRRSDLRRLFDENGLDFRVFPVSAYGARDPRFVVKGVLDNLGLSLLGHYCIGVRR